MNRDTAANKRRVTLVMLFFFPDESEWISSRNFRSHNQHSLMSCNRIGNRDEDDTSLVISCIP